jgi:ATP-dependent DNA helicase RecQ
MDDLIDQFEHLYLLEGKGNALPIIELEVYGSPEFETSELYSANHTNSHFDHEIKYDLVLDISLLQRPGFSHCPKTKSSQSATIRSAWHPGSLQKLYSGPLIEYRQVATRKDDNSFKIDSEAEMALQYFLRNIFRKKKFRKGQLEILSRALRGQSVIGLLPTGGGKSLTYQLAALLQPGFTLVIDPIKSLMKDQYDSLLRNRIDAAVFINSSIKDPKDRKKALEKMTSGHSIFTFVSPERMQIPEFRYSLARMEKERNFFAYCVIDEVHCVSEWGHDFRLSYLRLGENAINHCKTQSGEAIPLFGLTATASFDVLADVQRELAPPDSPKALENEAIVRFESTDRPELNYEVIQTSIDENQLPQGFDEWDIKKALGASKKAALNNLVKTIGGKVDHYSEVTEYSDTQLREKFEPQFFQKVGAGLVFCPHRSWHFGVTDRYKANPDGHYGVFDNLPSLPGMQSGTFIGSDHEDESVSAQIEADSNRNQEMFIGGSLNLLVATKAFGMGIDKSDIRFTVHFNYPSSIEGFVQEAGRAGRDQKTALGCILFNDQVIETQSGDIEVDQDILKYFHTNSFKGREKETWVIFSLLDQITFPDSNVVKAIANEILIEFEVQTQISTWVNTRNENDKRLYINLGFGDPIGYLRLPNLEIVDQCKKSHVPSAHILQFVRNYVLGNQEGNIVDWLGRIVNQPPTDGIERILEKLSVGETYEIVIGFSNDIPSIKQSISELLMERLKVVVPENNFLNLGGADFPAFLEGIERLVSGGRQAFSEGSRKFEDGNGLSPGDTLRRLKQYYYSYRGKADTEKAIYRMSCLGVIDDYEVNYNENTFTVRGRKKTDLDYIESLRNYVRKYYSEVSTNKRIDDLIGRKGSSELRKCLGFLVDFVYTEVVAKRKGAMNTMKDACYIGLEHGNKGMREYIDLYFNSKYARKGYMVDSENASLSDRTDEGKEESMDWVWEFISWIKLDKSGAELDNLKHLRGAAIRMLRPFPDNYVLLLLKAFSMFVLESRNEKLLKEAKESFAKGFVFRKENGDIPFPEFLKEMEKFKTLCAEFSNDPGIPDIITNEIQKVTVKTHRVWLEKYNNRLLEPYGS